MRLDDLLKQQKKRGLKSKGIKAKLQSYEDYARDDGSPRPYNTDNVADLSDNKTSDFNTPKPISDTKSTELVKPISDTKSSESVKPISDTKSTESVNPIRDTKSSESVNPIRDTKSTESVKPTRDTKSSESAKPIRDTKSSESVNPISDTKSTESINPIRDTKSASSMGRPPKSELYSYEDLTGNAKSLVDEIARKCLIVRENKTPWIDKLDFAQRTGVKLGAIKTTIIRLKERGVIVNYEASRGRNSAWSFTLSKAILNEYISLQR